MHALIAAAEAAADVAAAVVLRPSTMPAPNDIRRFVARHIAHFKVPRHVELVQQLPLNPSGKVLKFELRDRARKTVAG